MSRRRVRRNSSTDHEIRRLERQVLRGDLSAVQRLADLYRSAQRGPTLESPSRDDLISDAVDVLRTAYLDLVTSLARGVAERVDDPGDEEELDLEIDGCLARLRTDWLNVETGLPWIVLLVSDNRSYAPENGLLSVPRSDRQRPSYAEPHIDLDVRDLFRVDVGVVPAMAYWAIRTDIRETIDVDALEDRLEQDDARVRDWVSCDNCGGAVPPGLVIRIPGTEIDICPDCEQLQRDRSAAHTASGGWAHTSFAPTCSLTCPRCGRGGVLHHEGESHYCVRCDDYVAGMQLGGCPGIEPEDDDDND